MSRPGLVFGLKPAKKGDAVRPRPKMSSAVFGGDDDSDDDGAPVEAEEAIGGELELGTTAAATGRPRGTGAKSKNSAASSQGPKAKAKAGPSPMFGDLSSALTSQKNAAAAKELDPSVYEYDAVYDSLKQTKKPAAGEEEAEDGRRKPKYMQSLMRAAEVRKRDALIAEEKKIAREREAEGDEFADKEKFVTEAYKRQQEENRRLEEAEKRKEEEDARRNKGGGMSAFYRQLLDKDEERHAQVIKAAQERAEGNAARVGEGSGEKDEDGEEEDKERAEAALARELNEKGASVERGRDWGRMRDEHLHRLPPDAAGAWRYIQVGWLVGVSSAAG